MGNSNLMFEVRRMPKLHVRLPNSSGRVPSIWSVEAGQIWVRFALLMQLFDKPAADDICQMIEVAGLPKQWTASDTLAAAQVAAGGDPLRTAQLSGRYLRSGTAFVARSLMERLDQLESKPRYSVEMPESDGYGRHIILLSNRNLALAAQLVQDEQEAIEQVQLWVKIWNIPQPTAEGLLIATSLEAKKREEVFRESRVASAQAEYH